MTNEDVPKHVLLDLISTSRPMTDDRLKAFAEKDWQSFCEMAKQHRIGPMLHHRIQTSVVSRVIPADVRDEWAGAYRKAAFRYLSFRKTLARLNEILGTAHIPFAALKGAWLSQYAYADPALRPLRDIDILVEQEKALTVYALLEKNGFARCEDIPMPLEDALYHAKHLPVMRCTDTGLHLEVHTRLTIVPSGQPAKRTLDNVPFLMARRAYHDGVPYLSPTDTLLHLIVHAAYDHQFNNGPLTFSDIALLLECAAIDWPEFWEMAKAGSWTRGCIIILELASYYYGSDGWREFYDRSIRAPSPRQLESAALLSLQDFDHRGLVGFKAQITSDTSWFGKAHVLLNRAFPPLHDLAAFSGATTTSYWSLLYYPRWLAHQIHRVLFAKHDAGMLRDVDRAKAVRNWMYGN